MTKTADWYARAYTANFGFHLVPIEPGRKYPKTEDWGNCTLSDPLKAEFFYQEKPTWNMGVALGPSRKCSLDIDNEAAFYLIGECFGLDIKKLIRDTPTIKGRGLRLMFNVPDGVELPYRKLNWPSRNDPDGSKHKAAMAAAKAAKDAGDNEREARIRKVAKRWAIFTVFELRASGDGKQRQDVLPPSIHPETKQPYVWVTQPASPWPEPPKWLMAIWQDWDKIKPQIKAVCPWAIEPEVPQRAVKQRSVTSGQQGDVIGQYARSVSLESALAQYGYTQMGKRWLSPHSGTGLPGVCLLPDRDAAYIHHASDPLCSVETGHPVNSFDLFCYYECGGDISKAVKTAANILGIKPQHTVHNAPRVFETIDQDTGEVITTTQTGTVVPEAIGRDVYTPLPWVNGSGKPKAHIENLAEITRRLGITIRYNVIKKEEEILIPGQSFTRDNEANASLAWLTSECSLFDFPTGKVGEFVTYLSDQNIHNPVATWIESKPWDGQDRLVDFYKTLTAVGEAENPSARHLKETLMLRWMVSAVAAAFKPDGVSAAGVLVLQGGQYLGKTQWFKRLVPQDLELTKDGMLLRPDDKDSVKQCVSYWLVELGELDATFRRSDIAALKSFITNDRDVLRRAYARRESTYARRTVFFGSVNPKDYLHDPTGNRRYWTISCEAIDNHHTLDMQQVWAQVLALFREGEGYYLTQAEIEALNEHNTDFTALDPVEEKIDTRLDWSAPQSLWQWRTATDIAADADIDRPSKADVNAVATYIRKRNGDTSKRSWQGRLLLCPPKIMR